MDRLRLRLAPDFGSLRILQFSHLSVAGLSLAAFSIVLPYLGKYLKLISFRSELSICGYWNTPDGVSKTQLVEQFERQIENNGLSDLKESLYFPQSAEMTYGGEIVGNLVGIC